MANFCTACGSVLDAEGICTRKTCPRRFLQLKLKKAQKALDAVKSEAENKTAPENAESAAGKDEKKNAEAVEK